MPVSSEGIKWRYFEDLEIGEEVLSDEYEVTRDDVVEFATRYDPQYFHANPEEAKDHPLFQGLAASGIHTLAIWRILDHSVFGDVAWVCGIGWDEVRWRKPVFPGDRLRAWARFEEKTDWKKRDDIGRVRLSNELRNQDGEVVLQFLSDSLVKKRPKDE